MRLVILLCLGALAGCETSPPKIIACTEEAGKAPCCRPPTQKEIVCPKGVNFTRTPPPGSDASHFYGCVSAFGTYLDYVAFTADGDVDTSIGDRSWTCVNGRRTTLVDNTRFCFLGCWADDGSASTQCYSASTPACE